MELEPKHLIPYLCNKLQMQTDGGTVFNLIVDHAESDINNLSIGTAMVIVRSPSKARPILRHFSDLTEKEFDQLVLAQYGETIDQLSHVKWYEQLLESTGFTVRMTHYTLGFFDLCYKFHLDLWDLIPNGLAIEKTQEG